MYQRPSLSIVIFRKELREIFSDRRTLFAAIISPLLLTPAIIFLSNFFVQSQMKKERHTTYPIGIVGASYSPKIASFLKTSPNLVFVDGALATLKTQVADHKLKAAIVLPGNFDSAVASGAQTRVEILHDPGNDVSTSATQRVQGDLDAYSKTIRKQRLAASHLSGSFMNPIIVTDVATKGSGTTTMYLLAMFIPYVLAISAFSGGMASATDQIAGEKERGTLETLLVSPATRKQIVTGKFCAVACVCLTSGLLSVAGLTVPLSMRGVGIFPGASSLGGLTLSFSGALLIAIAQIPLALLFSGLLVAISAFSRNPKEVVVYQGPVLMLILVPAMGTMFAPSEQPLSSALVPVLNSTLVIKQVLAGAVDPPFIVLAIVCSVIYAAIGILIATSIFENEKILLKT